MTDDNENESGEGAKKERPDEAAIGSNFKEDRLGDISDLRVLKRLWAFMRPYSMTFFLCLLLLPMIAGLELLQPHLFQLAIDNYLMPGEISGITTIVVAFAGALGLRGAFKYLQFYLMQRAGHNALVDLRQAVFNHVQRRPIEFFHDTPVGRLMTRMTTDIESLQNAVSSGMVTMVGDLMKLVGIVGILLYKDWRLALVCFAVVPPLVGITAVFRYFLRQAFRDIRRKIARLYAHLQESITGMEVIQLFSRENVSADEYEDINAEYRNANLRSIRYDAMLYAIVEAIGSITVGCIIWYGSGQVLDGVITIGVLVAFIQYMQKFFVPIRDLAEKYNQLQSALASGERIFRLLDREERIPDPDEPEPLPEPPYHIEFDGVWFAYNDEEWVLEDVNFEINPGEQVALVGHTGAGKSTVINLLLRLYDVSKGEIRVNGTDIREFDLREYRRTFAVVLQDVFMFQGTIRENITLGKQNITDEDIQRASEIVRADELIESYPDGLDHELEERGTNLSEGEKQLLAFARALVRSPEVLVLDEATASVDTDTEALIQEAVEALLDRQTSLVIAHRLSTIESSERILVVDDGKIVERGTHEELLRLEGHYSKLYELQYADEASPAPDNSGQEEAVAVGE